MNNNKKLERVQLLLELANEVKEEAISRHLADGGDPREICFDESTIPELVDEYDKHLEAWRDEHINKGHNVDGDKIAAFTSTLIMRYEPFYSETEQVNTEAAAFVNHLYAVRVAELFIRRRRFHFTHIEQRMLLHCFTRCVDSDPAMTSWTVAAMAKYHEGANNKESPYTD